MIKQALFPLFCSCILSIQAQESSLPYITTWQGNRQAAVCYTFDDACPNQFKTAIPILDRYKAPATFFVSQAFNPDWNVLTAISRNGHEIASHTQTHCNLTDEVAETEYAQSNRLIESKTGNKVYTLAYPFCNAPSDSITARYYLGARICSGQIEKSTPDNFMRISSIVVGKESGFTTGESLVRLFRNTLQQNGCCILLIHEIDNGPGYSPLSSQALEESLEYIHNNPVFWVTTFKDYICYAKEKEAAQIKEIERSEKQISLTVTDNLPDSVYKTPVTVSYPLPEDWSDASINCRKKAIESRTEGNRILFDIIPDSGIVTINKK